jgi:dephospho-CoA kinase
MSKWRGKHIIGLTGNIATGKSVIRKMLEHLGALGIDADALSHRAMAKDAPGYKPVIDTFGKWVLGADGEIDRYKLGSVVFKDPAALQSLEKIVHPLVKMAIDRIIEHATQQVIVIEAIKLIESGLAEDCDSVWAVYSFPELQQNRLVKNRDMNPQEARQRIEAQPAQEDKVSAAKVVIKNISTFEDTWRQVVAAWKKYVSVEETHAEIRPTPAVKLPEGEIIVKRGGPRDAEEIAKLMTQFNQDEHKYTRDDIMAALGEKAYLILYVGDQAMGVLGWQVENLVTRATDIILNPAIPLEKALPVLISEMEQASRDLQCEASLIFVNSDMAISDKLWRKLGYSQHSPQTLGVLAWQEAAEETMPEGSVLFFKQLRQDRVLRPI